MSAFGRLRKVGQAGIAAAMLMLVNCSTSSQKLTEISLGMTKTQVVERLGRPSAARGAISNRYGQDIEVWEYELSTPKQETAGSILGKSALTVFTLGIGAVAFRPETADYWLFFHDDSLVRWGQAGDWSATADQIYELRINDTPTLTQ